MGRGISFFFTSSICGGSGGSSAGYGGYGISVGQDECRKLAWAIKFKDRLHPYNGFGSWSVGSGGDSGSGGGYA